MPSLSPRILSVLAPFSAIFSEPVWKKAIILLVGAILCRGKRTVCSVLRIMGLSSEGNFSKYHQVLNRDRWSPLAAAKILLQMLVRMVGENKPLVMFIDETLERRRGPKIKAKGYYRDAVRSSKSVVVKSTGLKWLTVSLSWRFPFSSRPFALPFISVLEPSERSDKAAKRRHKTTIRWTVQVIKWLMRLIKRSDIIFVGDGGFACGELAWLCLKNEICLISRLKMNACLYDFPPDSTPGKRGRKPTRGARFIGFRDMVSKNDLEWKEAIIEGYGKEKRRVSYISNTALWGADGFLPAPIRWILVIDPEGELDPIPLMSTDVMLPPERVIELYIQRWNLEVTFEEVREHLGVETQRQWSDKAIVRTTPILMSLYTIVCLIAGRLHEEHPIEITQAAWYKKKEATFSDLLKTVRKVLWKDSLISRKHVFERFQENREDLDMAPGLEGARDGPESAWIRVLIECLAAA